MSATFKGMKCMHYMCSVHHTSLSLNAANCYVGGVDEETATTRDGSFKKKKIVPFPCLYDILNEVFSVCPQNIVEHPALSSHFSDANSGEQI